jgi:exodeoxyribonuclease VII small subunit
MNDSNNHSQQYEKTSAELSNIVKQLESGSLSLEDSLQQFERGVQCIRQCQQILDQAQQRIQILNNQQLEDYNNDTNDGD